MRKLLIFLSVITISITAYAAETGSLYVSKLSTKYFWEGNRTGAVRDSVFTLVIDGKIKAQISKEKDAKIDNLELGKRHSIAVYLDNKKIESFYFKFENYGCNRLWLYYKTMYGTWILRKSSSCSAEQSLSVVDDMDKELFDAVKNQLSQVYTIEDIRNSVMHGLWNPVKTAIVITFHSSKKTTIYMFIPDKEEKYKAVDISLVENGNIGKIGIAGREQYSKIESTPFEWIIRKDENYQIKIRTRAWKDGQLYTVYEPLIVTEDGKPLYR